MKVKQVTTHISQFTQELESFIGPLLVFLISYFHHLYFAHHLVSSVFIAGALLSLIVVHAFGKKGIVLAAILQGAFLGWTFFETNERLLEQIGFSLSLSAGLLASFANVRTLPEQAKGREHELWQLLFDARQEITTLYQHKLEKEEALEKLAKSELVENYLEVALLEKEALVEERENAERDIERLLSHMHEMAQRQIPTPQSEKTVIDAMYAQLKQQFEQKSKTLDETRKELFLVNEQCEILKRSLIESEAQDFSEAEHAILLANRKIENLLKAHEEELLGYEQVIQSLLEQINRASKG